MGLESYLLIRVLVRNKSEKCHPHLILPAMIMLKVLKCCKGFADKTTVQVYSENRSFSKSPNVEKYYPQNSKLK